MVVFKPSVLNSNTENRQMRINFVTQLKTTLSRLVTEMKRPCEMLFQGLLFMLMTKITIIIIFVMAIIIIIIIIITMLLQAIVSTSFTKLSVLIYFDDSHPIPCRANLFAKNSIKTSPKINRGVLPSPLGKKEFISEGKETY